ncbi:porin [Sphingomonas sp.]|jgi:hypothetical protein|uniref:porin n=1 Tax=Sphingomonas sp. TaxID=28214 RepID=UPI0025FEF3A3|nr:porin [Sphingomonas sp.]
MKKMILGAATLVQLCALSAPAAGAETAEASPPPKSWSDSIKLSGSVEAGYTHSSKRPPDGINFGHLFTDRNNRLLLNQTLLTVERPIDSGSSAIDVGFKVQGMYGSDARYTHFLGELDRVTKRRTQFDVVEAFVQTHLPVLTAGGIDVKAGQFVTLEGAEVIPASSNFFYSHSYIFNFGIPFKHTGVLATVHASKSLDIYAGVTSGVNTTLGRGDNNGSPSLHGGVGLNLLGGALTIAATTSIGPEIPRGTPGVRPNHDLRYLNDMTVIWKVTPKLTSTTDFNYIRDDGFNASGGGIAQYLTYAVNDQVGVGIRGEVWRDSNAFFVAAFPGNMDFVNAEKGRPATVISGGKTTYGALTLGVNFKPTVPKPLGGILVRPEIRYDRSLNDTTPFAAGTRKHQLTLATDVVLTF